MPSLSSVHVFALIAVVAIVIGLLFIHQWRRHHRWHWLVAALAWIGYGLWEASVQWFTPEANLRVDLLLIYPVMMIVTLVAIVRQVRLRAST